MWILVLLAGCEDPGPLGCGEAHSLCDNGGDDTADTDDTGDTGIGTVCHDGDRVLIDSGKDPEGVHFEWSAEERFTKNGGVLPDEDTPSIVATCPLCVEGSTTYTVTVDYSDDKGRGLGYAYVTVQQVCEQ